MSLTNVLPTIGVVSEHERNEWRPMSNSSDKVSAKRNRIRPVVRIRLGMSEMENDNEYMGASNIHILSTSH